MSDPLRSLSEYSRYIAESFSQPNVKGSTVAVWSDSPYDPTLALTFPHHKHIPPDIKHHRIPATEMSYNRPNLPVLINEIEELGKS